jgi:hypothetical protein
VAGSSLNGYLCVCVWLCLRSHGLFLFSSVIVHIMVSPYSSVSIKEMPSYYSSCIDRYMGDGLVVT